MNSRTLLNELRIEWKRGTLNAEIKGIAYDSRLVQKDYLFVAVRGFSFDGHDFIKDAVNRGATLVVAEHPVDTESLTTNGISSDTTLVCVRNSREALALLAATYYGHPSERLSLVGITGTNGKTTSSFITKSIIDAGSKKAGLLGTICYMTGERTASAVNTTPESLDVQRYLKEMLDNSLDYAVLEVSSHALALERVRGCTFKTAVFTNFTQDHLDFHHTMDGYFESKCRIFDLLEKEGTAILNYDDMKVKELADRLNCKVMTFGVDRGAMIRAENISGLNVSDPAGLSFDVLTPDSKYRIQSGLAGRFNVYNILSSIGIAMSLGISDEQIRRGIRQAKPVAGRFEIINEGQEFNCVLDYAHTEDALRKVLQEAGAVTKGRVITVFGCGGDRDRKKRPMMGKAASELSDVVIITSDNPRSEDPGAIIRDVLEGVTGYGHSSEPDRRMAIYNAVSMAQEGDTVVIAGKGHENYQEINGERIYFSDREILIKAIKERMAENS